MITLIRFNVTNDKPIARTSGEPTASVAPSVSATNLGAARIVARATRPTDNPALGHASIIRSARAVTTIAEPIAATLHHPHVATNATLAAMTSASLKRGGVAARAIATRGTNNSRNVGPLTGITHIPH